MCVYEIVLLGEFLFQEYMYLETKKFRKKKETFSCLHIFE